MGVKSVIPITPRIEDTALVDEGEKQPPSPPSARGLMHLKPCSPRAIDRRALPQPMGQVITGMQPFKLRTRRGYLNCQWDVCIPVDRSSAHCHVPYSRPTRLGMSIRMRAHGTAARDQ